MLYHNIINAQCNADSNDSILHFAFCDSLAPVPNQVANRKLGNAVNDFSDVDLSAEATADDSVKPATEWYVYKFLMR